MAVSAVGTVLFEQRERWSTAQGSYIFIYVAPRARPDSVVIDLLALVHATASPQLRYKRVRIAIQML